MATTLNCKIPVLQKGKHVMTSDYGMRTLTVKGKTTTKLHKGVDVVGAGHTLDYIVAFADGVVKAAGYNSSMGYYARIDHGKGVFTRYMHMKKGSLAVKAGQTVKMGQVLGYMGASGNVTGAHLHFDICINNEYVDPKPYLKGEKDLLAKAETGNERVREWQIAAMADGFKFPKAGADGVWGSECESIAKKAVVKKRVVYKYKNLTKIVQAAVGVKVDGYCGKDTDVAIRAWQKKNGLSVDGSFGPASWRKLLTGK